MLKILKKSFFGKPLDILIKSYYNNSIAGIFLGFYRDNIDVWMAPMANSFENAGQLDSRAITAKQSPEEMERLIEDFKPFLNARVAKYSLRTDGNQREELFSVALVAFHEAIQKYDAAKGHFFPFANHVVCERIIDGIRSFYRQNDGKTVPIEQEDDEYPSSQSMALNKMAMRSFEAQSRQETLKYEIQQFKEELLTWGITMNSLGKHAPKHKGLLETYKQVVVQICQNPDILQTIQLKRYFPVKPIVELTGLPQKKLERGRIFIIATLIIKFGDYDYLSEYVAYGR